MTRPDGDPTPSRSEEDLYVSTRPALGPPPAGAGQPPAAEPLPDTIGEFAIRERLGAGGMGTVYLAEDDAGERVALKVIHPHLVTQPGLFKRFVREAEVGRRVRHENVVRTLDIDFTGTHHFLVLEYVQGRTLRQLKADLGGTVPEALLRQIALQVAHGLAAIHDSGIVHRDLKPDNILITEDQKVRIMDLGLARLIDGTRVLTRDGQFAGTFLYAAPEQVDGRDVGPAADLYSLGILLHELGTGERPGSVATGGADSAELSPFLSGLLGRLAKRDPAERLESAAELARVLVEGERGGWWDRQSRVLPLPTLRPRIGVTRDTPLAGRDEEIAVLGSCWEEARNGDGALVLLEGEAGIGKTRLVDEFLRTVGDDAAVLYGSYAPNGGAGAVSEAVAQHLGTGGLADALAELLPTSARMAPALAATLRHLPPPAGAPPIREAGLSALLVDLMHALAARKPLVWVVDDLHFAGSEELARIAAMARAVSGHRVLLLLTTRPGLEERTAMLLAKAPGCRRIALPRLSPRAVIQVLRDAFSNGELAERLGGKVAYKSDGVPLFVFEIVRGLREAHRVVAGPDGTFVEDARVEEVEVPSTVRDMIQERLSGLAEHDREMLDIAACCGFRFDPVLVATVMGEEPIPFLRGLARLARERRIVRSSGRDYEFDHHQIQETLYEELPVLLREQYHAAIAGRIEQDGGPVEDICEHYLKAGRGDVAAPLLEETCNRLRRTHEHERMVGLACQALEMPGVLEGDARFRVALEIAHGYGSMEADRAVKYLDIAMEMARTPAQRIRALTAKGGSLLNRGLYDQALELLREAKKSFPFPEAPAIEARAWSAMGSVHRYQCRRDESQECYAKAIAVAQASGEVMAEAQATMNMGLGNYDNGEFEEARGHLERAFALATKAGDEWLLALVTCNLGLCSYGLGEFEEAYRANTESLARSREIGARRGEVFSTGNLGLVEGALGNAERAMELHARQLVLTRECAMPTHEVLALLNLSAETARLGAFEKSREYIDAAAECCERYGFADLAAETETARGWTAEYAGDLATAEAAFREALERFERDQVDTHHRIAMAVSLGRVLLHQGRREEALPVLLQAHARSDEDPAHGVLAGLYLAEAGVLGADRAQADFLEREERLQFSPRLDGRLTLARVTGDEEHREEARRLVRHLHDNAPYELRGGMARVADYRDLLST